MSLANCPGRNSSFRQRFSELLPWLFLCLTYLAALLFQAKYGDDLLNSDMSAEMILAKELNDSGSLFLSDNWFYPSELRILYQHIPFRLGLLLFPNNWLLVRVFGQAIMLALQAGSFIYLMSALGHKKAGVWGAAALMLPFGFWYLFHGIYTGAYLTHMILLSVTMGLILDLSNGTSKGKTVLLGICLLVLCLFQGLNGIRMLMNLYAPLCIAVVLLFAFRFNKAPLETPVTRDPSCKLVFWSFLGTITCAGGYLIHSALTKIYPCITYEDRFWTAFNLNDLIDILSKFLRLFGYPYDGWASGLSNAGWSEISLLSLHGILGAASFVLMFALIFAMYRLSRLWDRLPMTHQVIAALFPATLVVSGVSYTCLTGFSNGSYWLPLVPLTFAVVILWIINENFRLKELYQKLIGAALVLCLMCTSVPTVYQFVHYPPRTPQNMKPVTQWLLDNGYTQGYATFWYAGVLTELSNGEIEVWSFRDSTEGSIDSDVYPVLQKRSHYEAPPEGECFILLSEKEFGGWLDPFPFHLYDDTVVYEQDGYVVLAYESAELAMK